MTDMELEAFAARVRDACLKTVIEAYDDAGVQGLCAEGRWEAAVGALRALDVSRIVSDLQRSSGNPADH